MKHIQKAQAIRLFLLSIMIGSLSGCLQQDFTIGKDPGRIPGSLPASPGATPASSPSEIGPVVLTPVDSVANSPVAMNDGPFETAQNQALAVKTSDLLLNDSDPAHSAISFDGFDQPSSGSLTLNAGNLNFLPALDFIGSLTFQYRIKNTQNLQAIATVTINVRRAAVEPMYAQSPNTLFKYDAITQTSTLIASFKLQNGCSVSILDIAITSGGLMYGVDGSSLYYIDATTGILTKIQSDFGIFGNINGLTALSDGRLVIGGNGLASYNIATKEIRTLLEPGAYQSAGDVVALPDGFLYLTANGSGSDQLIRIDPNSSAVIKIGDLGVTGVYGLGYANHKMYGFAGNGSVFEINPVNASISNSKSTQNVWYGATTNPVKW